MSGKRARMAKLVLSSAAVCAAVVFSGCTSGSGVSPFAGIWSGTYTTSPLTDHGTVTAVISEDGGIVISGTSAYGPTLSGTGTVTGSGGFAASGSGTYGNDTLNLTFTGTLSDTTGSGTWESRHADTNELELTGTWAVTKDAVQ